LRDWLRELVAVPESEYPRFQAALSWPLSPIGTFSGSGQVPLVSD
jgi:hypothetical protein